MERFKNIFGGELNPKAEDGQCIIIGDTRITVILPRLIRIERDRQRLFCDSATQTVLCRNFGKVPYTITDNKSSFAIKTEAAAFVFSEKCELICVNMEKMTANDFKGENLKGTARTLDLTNGSVLMSDGVLSKNGVAVLDDSKSLIFNENMKISKRKSQEKDEYIFAYGRDYKSALKDFYKLCGKTPLIPRYALGNWWSRYKAYTQQEYLSLTDRFIKEEIPITVATVDMDWHWVDVISRFGKRAAPDRSNLGVKGRLKTTFLSPGWTGYSWNTELFPDYKAFLDKLQKDNFKVTVNLHPSDGVRFFEDMYDDFADFMGVDKKSKKPIEFDMTDDKFIEGYFKFLHHPYENDGVDFWWIDWQQGNKTKIPGLDPLWLLNHYHFIDSARNGKRPLILSRFAGAGSHRYPLGFSGDTVISWRSLNFQPYFTATASNIGYSWWSHDIGGHCMGIRDDELYLRWVQLGVFSPIMRLHSTSNEFSGKEPWKYCDEVRRNVTAALKFRHRLIPYIYTMNMRTHKEGLPLISPMYYENPNDEEAYNVPNEFYFGTELIVAPITTPSSDKTLTGSVDVYLPKGRYTDIFTGRIYYGGKKITMHRDKSSIPTLAKEGAIIPLDVNDKTNNCGNPQALELLIYRGHGSFTLYEDDGETMAYENGAFAQTKFEVSESSQDVIFTAHGAQGDLSLLPKEREYRFSFRDIADCEKVIVTIDGKRAAFNKNGMQIIIKAQPQAKIKITIKAMKPTENMPKREALIELLSKVQGQNGMKKKTLMPYLNGKIPKNDKLHKDIKSAILEILNCQ